LIGRLVVAYAAWLLALAFAGWAVTSLHGLAMGVYVLLRLGPWGVAAYQNAVFLVLVIAWLCWVVASEHWLRTAADRKRLGPALVRVVLPVAAIAAVSFGLVQMS
jgi:hypothetical protein